MRILVLLFSAALLVSAQGVEYIKAHYTKFEYEVPMRDGKKLFTAVYEPKDTSTKYPIMMLRTPYSVAPYGADQYKSSLGPSEKFAREGFIFVYQDVRGCWMSEGDFVDVRPYIAAKRGPQDVDEASDTYDSIEWLLHKIANHNGRVGIWGISYPGFYAAMSLLDSHPALKAVSPQAPIADWFVGDDFHHNGVLWLAHTFRFYGAFGRPRPVPTTHRTDPKFEIAIGDGYKFFLDMGPVANADAKYFKGGVPFWNQVMQHPNYDEFWKARTILPYLKKVTPAVMTVGGWLDAEDVYGPLAIYRAVEKNNPGAYNVLVEGPWPHGGWSHDDGERLGNVSFNSKTGPYYREHIEFPFFNFYLKNKGDLKLPEAYVFETGTNQWRQYDAWPPRQAVARPLYLEASGKLAFEPPRNSSIPYDEYVSDPAKPVPYVPTVEQGMVYEYMDEDQRFASRRADVLVYQTDVLTSDLTVAGPLTATFYVSTSGTDSDWVVKLIDVYPQDRTDVSPSGVKMGGYEQLVRGEPMRGRFRSSFEKPEPFEPGRVTKVEFTMPDINHSFRKGHRVMVQIQSSWFPLGDRNPQKFVDINTAKDADFQKATQRVYHSPRSASRLMLTVLP
ncbi:MAG: CocE/NonD family hydrolase [Acidobacteriales bacterium]|nr:CocE/NonD family hydrolase [Terriglobales bacterium]